ncbi:MAG: pyridoxamine 5'-phosphate oxidase [Rhodospirillaceae bacterium]
MPATIPDTTDPLGLFRLWLQEAEASESDVPNAMCLSTVGPGHRPSSRMVLLKDLGPSGFVFYTNTESRKGREIAQNPFAAACFHWKTLGRQIRIEGRLSLVSAAEADAYWATRPRGSQIAAWASDQSQPLDARASLEARVAEAETRFAGADVPRLPHWLGYALDPDMIEFWLGVANRLHDRLMFSRVSRGWRPERLNP